MKYRDLVQFEPIESVVQLRDADEEAEARHLVETYVISDRMADQLANVVIPQLQFLSPRDDKGVLIVGNYGTGKSHFMAVVSAVAEYADLVPVLDHDLVREAARPIAGHFKVIRTEIGGVTGSLRDILLRELEIALENWGTPFTFPPADQVTNNKDAIIAAVGVFQERYPDHGILLVVDELLDYLRTREERQLILDLGFLRELGEVAALTPFRFLGGLQETLFDNPRFSFVAEQLHRVRDRFEQVHIAREDIAYVVSHRLLCKTDEQLALITAHLRQFTPLYGRMAERLDEFAQLFPIHPAYLETFERLYVAEKREVLKTLSRGMRALLDQEVPADQPGLISYDHYWDVLRGNPSMRGLAGVAEVIEKSNVLEGRIQSAYTRPHLLPVALRIIHALSVHRLTTSDIYVPLGATPEELRDGLCLWARLPESSADFLLDQVQVTLREIMRTVSGQYISYNEANGQYYLDVKKDIDFDAKIAERGDFFDDVDLNPYFFDALRQALNLSDTTYVTNYRIWFYELPWPGRKVTRPGYLFFGTPDERSTAQPPRDFYVYVLPPFLNREWHDEERSDEVILQLTGLGQIFTDFLRQYAGARAMANEAASHREIYTEKADKNLQRLLRWLREHLTEHLQVTYQGVTEPLGTVLTRTRSTASQTIEELLRLVAAHLLAPDFEECYPDYPAFRRLTHPVSEAARPTNAMEAIRFLAGRGRTNLALGVLEGLELVDSKGVIRPYQSRYARCYLDLLQKRSAGQVVNRGELLEQVASGIDQPIEKDLFFQLEPEWAVVVLLALVYNGDIVLNLGGRTELDASTIERAAMMAIADLTDFRFYKRPRTLPLNLWTMIFEGLGLSPGLVRDENTRAQAVRDLQRIVGAELERTATLQGRLQQGVRLWNAPLFTDRFTVEVEAGTVIATDLPEVTLAVTELLPSLRGYKQFLETLSRFNTVGKLRNLRLTISEVTDALADQTVVNRAEQLSALVDRIQPLTTYLAEAQANLPVSHPWSERAAAARQSLLDDVRRLGRGEKARTGPALAPCNNYYTGLARELETLKSDYITAYAKLHRQLVLGPQADDRRQRLYNDPRLAALNELSTIDLLSGPELELWKQALSALPTCREFHEGIIADTPTCPSCHLRPAQHHYAQADQTLDQLDQQLDGLLARWRQALRANLTSEPAQRSRKAMTPAERKPLEQFLAQDEHDSHIPEGFAAAATQALRGIETLTLPVDDLLAMLKEGGLPCTVEELQHRFTEFVSQNMRGHDPRNTRLTLDR